MFRFVRLPAACSSPIHATAYRSHPCAFTDVVVAVSLIWRASGVAPHPLALFRQRRSLGLPCRSSSTVSRAPSPMLRTGVLATVSQAGSGLGSGWAAGPRREASRPAPASGFALCRQGELDGSPGPPAGQQCCCPGGHFALPGGGRRSSGGPEGCGSGPAGPGVGGLNAAFG
jgi:hypothetical protein